MIHELRKEKPHAYFVNVSVYFSVTYDKFFHHYYLFNCIKIICFDNASLQ